jgi:hypothetical protein
MSTDYPYSAVQFAQAKGGGTALQTSLNTILGATGRSATKLIKVEVISAKLHLDGTSATSQNFFLKENSSDGTSYDVVVHTQDMSGIADNTWTPTKPFPLKAESDLDGSFQNAGGLNWGLEIAYRTLF